jgi:hypothetical protein
MFALNFSTLKYIAVGILLLSVVYLNLRLSNEKNKVFVCASTLELQNNAVLQLKKESDEQEMRAKKAQDVIDEYQKQETTTIQALNKLIVPDECCAAINYGINYLKNN